MGAKEPVYDSDIPDTELTATASVLAKVRGIFPQYAAALDKTNVQFHKRIGPSGETGSYTPDNNTIQIGSTARAINNPDDFAATILHETMHARNETGKSATFDANQGSIASFKSLIPGFASTRMTANLPPDRLELIKTAAGALAFPSTDSSGNISTEEMMATLVPGMDNTLAGHPINSRSMDLVDRLHSLYPNAVNALFFSDRNPEVIGTATHTVGPRNGPLGKILDSLLGQQNLSRTDLQIPEDNPTDSAMRAAFGLTGSNTNTTPIELEEKSP